MMYYTYKLMRYHSNRMVKNCFKVTNSVGYFHVWGRDNSESLTKRGHQGNDATVFIAHERVYIEELFGI